MSILDDIFNSKSNLSSIIQFDLLQNVIFELIKRQQNINNTLKIIRQKINLDDIEINENNSQNKDEINQPDNMINKNSMSALQNKLMKNQLSKQNINYEINNSSMNNIDSNTSDIISNLNLRLDSLESSLKDTIKNSNSNNLKLQKQFEETNKTIYTEINKNENLFSNINEKLDNLIVKVQDFNVYDIFKDSNNTNLDAATGLIKNLELKIKKKLDLIDEKNKLNDEIIIKTKNDLTTMKNASESSYNLASANKENLEKYIQEYKIEIDGLKKKINDTIDKMKKSFKNNLEEKTNSLQKIIEEQNSKINELIIENNKKPVSVGIGIITQEKLTNSIDSLKNSVYKQVNDSENYLKNMIKNLDIEQIKKDILNLKNDLSLRLIKNDLTPILLKFEENENKILGVNDQLSQIKTSIDIVNETNNKLVKKVEWLNAAYASFKHEGTNISHQEKLKKNIEYDFSKYITHSQLNQELNKIAEEMTKMQNEDIEIRKYAEQIENRFQYFASENDLKNLEQCLLNSLEEYKISAIKKFSDKIEIQKQFKYLELQIKHLAETYMSKDNSDNWLLAKKPMNNFHCASCDSYIGELSSRNEYSTWNKLIPHEENNKYRMGHGFSRMLQMVNVDLLKSAEGVKDNFIVDDEIKDETAIINNIKDDNIKKKLPRIISQNNIKNNNGNIFLNNNNEEKEIIVNESADNNIEGPKLVKIYRKNKVDKS